MQITIECDECVSAAMNGKAAAVYLGQFRVDVRCSKEAFDLANKAVRAAISVLQGEKA